MGKIIFMMIMVLSISSIFAVAVIVQDHYRWRNDDGTEVNATWKAAEDAGITIDSDDNIRIRFDISNRNDETEAYLSAANLQYSLDETNWIDITTDNSTNHFVLSLSDYFADGDPAPSNLLTNHVETTTQASGNMYETTTYFGGIFSVVTGFEYEWCIKPTANITDTNYYFRIWGTVTGGSFSNTFSSAQSALLIFSEQTPPNIPQNVTINIDSEGIVTVNWDEVTGATGYKIYGCEDSYGTFIEIPEGDGEFSGTSWTSNESMGNIKFFEVTAING